MEVRHGGLSANALKCLAIVAMLIDHTALTFLPPSSTAYIIMRFIGRFTAPIMFYFVVEGYHRTRDINRYTLRMALFAVISYVPFVYLMTGAMPGESNFLRLNVIYTIFIGILFIRAKNEITNLPLKILVMTALIILSVPGDWWYIALLMMLVFDHFRGEHKMQMFGYLLVILTAGNLIAYIIRPFVLFMNWRIWDFSVYIPILSEFGMLVPIFLLGCYNGSLGGGGKVAKWGFYLFYPIHLLLLAAVRDLIL